MIVGPIELHITIDGRLVTGAKRLVCEPFRDEFGGLRRRITGALTGECMVSEHPFLEKATLTRQPVEMAAYVDITAEHIISQGQIEKVRLVWDGTDTVCEFEFVGNAKLPI